ncbi:MAG: hypothetical protein GY811_18380 [Myxococcales bacterium]|nr:hypothetical protein [Myxococcales bacterium]
MGCLALSVPAATRFALLFCALVACGDEQPTAPEKPATLAPVVASPAPAPAPEAPPEPEPALEIAAFDTGVDEATSLREIHSLPAWAVALERFRFLARRGQSGPTHGLLIATDDGPRLVDESTGDGALSIAVSLPEGLAPSLPMRAVVWGAWKPHEGEPTWRWHAQRVASLPASARMPSLRVPFEPIMASRPKRVVLASESSRRGGPISFVIKKRSSRAGDGWLIADNIKAPAIARLLLPGERETYGDQSELASDERWKLKKGTRYWLTIRSFRPDRPGELPVFKARTAPFRDPKAPSAAPVLPDVP